jgi:5S rRNA maturation endonuclease (ribonuclease M5)
MKQRKLSGDILEKVEEIISEAKIMNYDTPILVEGRKDREALRLLGFKGAILLINKGKSLSNVADNIAMKYERIIILTDWDKKGDFLAERMRILLEDNDVECNMEIRRRLSSLLSSHITTVEELTSIEF